MEDYVHNILRCYMKISLPALILVDSTSMNLNRLDELHLPISDSTDSNDMWLEKYNTYSKMDVDTL